MATLGSLLVKIGVDQAGLQKGLKKTEKMIGGAARNIGKGLALGAAGGAVILGTTIGGIGINAFTAATDVQAATAQIQSALGYTAEQAEQLGAVGLQVFENNFTGSIGEATAAVGLAAQQLRNITFEELQGATENGLKLADAFGVDLTQSLNAANVLMTQFDLTQQQAFDFLASGFQKGLDSSGDFLDSITEYGNLFSNAGSDAGQFFSLMESGLQGGVLGTDKIADAFKEFQIRFLEGHDDMSPALATLGINYNKLFSQVDSGAITMADAFGLVTMALKETDMTSLENQAAVAKLGTQFEDLGANAVSEVSTVQTSMDDLTGATATLDAQYDTLSVKLEALGRKMTTALAPVGEAMVTMVENALPAVEGFVNFFAETGVPALMQFATAFNQTFSDAAMTGQGEGGMFSGIKEAWETELAELAESDALTRISEAFGRISSALNLEEGMQMTFFSTLSNELANIEEGISEGVEFLEGLASVMEGLATYAEASQVALAAMKAGLVGWTAPAALETVKNAIAELASWAENPVISWFVRQSPVPFAEGLKAINREARRMPNVAQAMGIPDLAGAPDIQGIARAGQSSGDTTPSDGGGTNIFHIIIDGEIIETIVSGRQGVKRQQRAAMGGATRL